MAGRNYEMSAGTRRGWDSDRVGVYLHVATMGRYQEVVEEVLTALAQSALASSIADLQIHVVGDGFLTVSPNQLPSRVIRTGKPVTAFEMPTLGAIRSDAMSRRFSKVLYLNCLGGRHVGSGYEVRRAWRELIAYELIERGPDCLEELQSRDLVGIEWARDPMPHMTSNNWWASGAYLATLDDPETFAETVVATNLSGFGASWEEPERKRRHAGEFWIGSGQPQAPGSQFPLSRSGLPTSELGLVPWWGMPGIEWGRLARGLDVTGRFEARHGERVLYYRGLFFARSLSRAWRAGIRSASRRKIYQKQGKKALF